MRLDKWLWAARFFKTRSLAQQAVASGKVKLNGERPKPAHGVKPGDGLRIRIGELEWDLVIRGLDERRGPAERARQLYEETPEGQAERLRVLDLRRLGAAGPVRDEKGRPTKRDRRLIDRFTEN